MFDRKKKRIILGIACLLLFTGFWFKSYTAFGSVSSHVNPGELIRFHVIANSDSEEDQMLKYAVRDEILQQVAPRLAKSTSLAESRKMIQEMAGELTYIAQQVVNDWGKDYSVSLDYGKYLFPTKSYGNIVLAGGEYEAVKIKIGKAEGANWWCVLFPPLCFVNVEESTTVAVDGHAGIPLGAGSEYKNRFLEQNTEQTVEQSTEQKMEQDTEKEAGSQNLNDGLIYKGKKVGFFLARLFK